MDEQKIRRIVQEELRRSAGDGRFGLRSVPKHAHTGNDGTPRIQATDILPSVSVSGSITFAAEAIYTIKLNGLLTPRSVVAYGNVIGSGTERYAFVGSAQLGPSFYLQPETTRSVVPGGPQYPFIDPNFPEYGNNIPMQSSSYYGSETNTGARHTLAGNGHIIDIQYSGIHARATVIDFGRDSITVAVSDLDAGWEINANFVVT